MSRLLFIIIILISHISCASLVPYQQMPSGTYKLDKTHASIIWQVSHLGLSDYTARFADFDAMIEFNAKNPEQSQVSATINSFSIKTQYPYPEKKDFDKKLQNKDWFNSAKFPKIIFKSKKIKNINDKKGIMIGDLTFLGITKEITMDVTFNGAMQKQPFTSKPTLGFKATTSINRSDWKMDTYIPNIGDEVKIIFDGEFGM
ncbi:YceI family protein [Rickettsiales bacterium]|nr:YceI family protein [Rickettsiales bacterium]